MADPLTDLLHQAQSGDADAQYTVGNAYHFGAGVSKQLPVAMRWYLKAAAQGHRDAQVNLGLMFLQESPHAGMARNPTQARYWFRRAAEGGDGQAMFYLARALLDHGSSSDRTAAMEWLERAADAGYACACTELGLLFGPGQPDEDPRRAAAAYRRGAELGDMHAQFNLANCHLLGDGVPVDLHEVERWYRAAAEQGLIAAQYHLGLLLLAGQGRAPDPAQGMHWLTRAADQGMAEAQYELARQLRGGPGVEPDPLMVLHYLHEAADQDHVQAMYALALRLEWGEGLDRAYPEQAAQWYRKLARDHGHGPAAHNLGILHVEGRGVEQNVDAALDMFQLAIALDCNEAMYSLALLHCAGGTARDFEAAATWSILSQEHCPKRGGAVLLAGIGRRLDAGQLESARRTAEDWKRRINPDRAERATEKTLAETI
jgi:TPR repeat protein